ncbi:MAG: tetratricopeptide repeat protein [Bacteroidetes bacterium]|nr:tetratricopeptide repeat protein [Bacteroidota bacterium]
MKPKPSGKKSATIARPALSRKTKIVIAATLIGILLVTWFPYRSTLHSGFTVWDDPDYVLYNAQVHSLDLKTVSYFFTNQSARNYHPLTMISLAIDYHFSKTKDGKVNLEDDAVLFHRVNLILHLLNVILVFVFIFLLSKRNILIAAICSLLFGIHPLHVESVAWITERKDVLYTFFFLLGLISYLYYLESKKILLFLPVVLFFLLSLFSKPAAVIFPLILMAIDFYRQRKFTTRSILEKIPLLILSATFGVITYMIQSKTSISAFSSISIIHRVLFVCYGFLMYLFKLVVPLNQSVFYPVPAVNSSGYLPVIFYICPIIVLGLAGLMILSYKYTRVFIFGMLFYFFSVILVLQVISIGSVIISERYTYLSYVGLFFIIAWYLDYFLRKQLNSFQFLKYVIAFFLILYLSALSFLTYQRNLVWKDPVSLWSDVIRQYPTEVTAYVNLGEAFEKQKNLEAAMDSYEKSVQYGPDNGIAWDGLGRIHGLLGEYEKSVEALTKSIEVKGTSAITYLNRGISYSFLKDYPKAIDDYTTALSLSRDDADRFNISRTLAYTLVEAEQYKKAIDYYNFLIGIQPDNDDFYLKRGVCHYHLKNYPEAISDFTKASGLNPKESAAFFDLAITYYDQKNYTRAYYYAEKAKSMGFNVDATFMKSLAEKKNRK